MAAAKDEERRRAERYDLQFPAKIYVQGRETPLNLFTRDISSRGAFFCTEYPLQTGVRVVLEIVIENETLKRLSGHESCVKITGYVIRKDSDGMAVVFDGHEEIMPLRSTMDN